MLNIKAVTVPHKEQRFPTVGDYFQEGDTTKYIISELGDDGEELLVLIHEMIESYLCKRRGIAWNEIDAFDKTFEAIRKEGDVSEPGNDSNAPYYKEHQFATNIERMLALEFGINWNEYDKKVNEL